MTNRRRSGQPPAATTIDTKVQLTTRVTAIAIGECVTAAEGTNANFIKVHIEPANFTREELSQIADYLGKFARGEL